MLVVVDERAEVEELGGRPRSEPLARRTRVHGRATARAARELAHVGLEPEEVVAPRLHAHEQAVEGSDVDTDGVVVRLEALHERRAGAGERIEHATSGRDVAVEERLDELRDELPEIRMEPVDVLRPLALGKLRLRPGQMELLESSP